MSNLIIALSGASHSGKTTFIEKMKKQYPNDIVLLNEEIRKINIGNIDDIRKDPIKYLNLQFKIIQTKIDAEKEINENYKNKIILIDRSLVDSYFYYTFYVDKAKFTDEQQLSYHRYMKALYDITSKHCNHLYNFVYFLRPITNLTRKDEYTQKNLSFTQINEYRHMELLTLGIFDKHSLNKKLKYFDATTDYASMEYHIKEFITYNKNFIKE